MTGKRTTARKPSGKATTTTATPAAPAASPHALVRCSNGVMDPETREIKKVTSKVCFDDGTWVCGKITTVTSDGILFLEVREAAPDAKGVRNLKYLYAIPANKIRNVEFELEP